MSFPERPFGFVAGRWVRSIGDTPDDADRAPDYVPVGRGTVTFTPQVTHRVAADGPGWAGIIKERVLGEIGERGQLVDAEGHDHLALAVGVYSVSYDLGPGRSWPSHHIEVKPEHTAEAPLWLPPIVPPAKGPMIENRVVTIPADGEDGQVLVWDGGGFSWMDTTIDEQLIEAAQLRDEQVAISGITGEDTAVAHLIADQDSATRKALDPTYATGDPQAFWEPPTQPASASILTTDKDLSAWYDRWDTLVANHPGYGSRTHLGMDSTGTHPVYSYTFTPDNYQRTIILGSGMHGGETMAVAVLYRLMYHICNDYGSDRALAYLRTNVRIVTVPVANPAGMVAVSRGNGRGVDLNRNFPYGWAGFESNPSDVTYKGTAPLSENETQYLDTLMSTLAEEGATVYLDLHNTGPVTPEPGEAMYYCGVPAYSPTSRAILSEVALESTPATHKASMRMFHSAMPTAGNTAANIHGLHAATVEYQPGARHGVTAYSPEDMTDALRYIGNVILRYAQLPAPVTHQSGQPFAVEVTRNVSGWASTEIREWEPIPEMGYTFTPTVPGVLEVTAQFTFINTDASAITYLVPVVTQTSHSGLLPEWTVTTQQNSFDVYTEPAGKRATLVANRAVGVINVGTPVTVAAYCKTSAGVAYQHRQRLFVRFTPSDSGRTWTWYRGGSQEYPLTVVS